MTKEELKELGLNEEQIKSVFKINGQDIENAKQGLSSKEAELKLAKQQLEAANEDLKDANKEIQSYKDMDIDSIKKSADEYKEKYEQAQEDAKEQVENLKFANQLDQALIAAQAKNPKAVKAVLGDLEELKKAEDREEAINKALEEIKETDDYLFGAKEENDEGTGGSLLGGQRNKKDEPKENYGATLGKNRKQQDPGKGLDAYKA